MDISIGENIRRLRKESKMTQHDLAQRLNVSTQAVSKWERSYSYPDVTLLMPIAEIFSVTLDELFLGEDAGANQIKQKTHHSNNE